MVGAAETDIAFPIVAAICCTRHDKVNTDLVRLIAEFRHWDNLAFVELREIERFHNRVALSFCCKDTAYFSIVKYYLQIGENIWHRYTILP